MRTLYFPGDIVAVLNVSSHYLLYNFEIKPDYDYKDSIYQEQNLRELKPTVQGQLYYVRHIDHERQYILLAFDVHVNVSFTAPQLILYRRPLRNHIKALVHWLKHIFYFSSIATTIKNQLV